jgi:hypothetical protein
MPMVLSGEAPFVEQQLGHLVFGPGHELVATFGDVLLGGAVTVYAGLRGVETIV